MEAMLREHLTEGDRLDAAIGLRTVFQSGLRV